MATRSRFYVASLSGWSGYGSGGKWAVVWMVLDRAYGCRVVREFRPNSQVLNELRQQRALALAYELNRKDPRPMPSSGAEPGRGPTNSGEARGRLAPASGVEA